MQLGALMGPFFWLSSKAQAGIHSFQKKLQSITGAVYFSGSSEFAQLKKIVNQILQPKDPMAIVQTDSLSEIQRVTKQCAEASVPVRIRSGGHSFESFSMGEGVVVDTRRLNRVEIDPINDWVKVGAGVTLGELRVQLDREGLAFPTGSCPSVGVAGYLLGGGHSRQSRLWGLGADRVQAIDIIDAGGKAYKVSPSHYPELYWSLLGGGGGNFAIVTAFYLDIIKKVDVISFSLRSEEGDFSAIYSQWESFISIAEDNITANLFLSLAHGEISQVRVAGMISLEQDDNRDPQTIFEQSIPQRVRNYFAKAQIRVRKITNFSAPQNMDAQTFFKGTSHYADEPIGLEGFKFIEKSIGKTLSESMTGVIEINPMGGKILIPERNNCYPHRQSLYSMGVFLQIPKHQNPKELFEISRIFSQELSEVFSGRHYVNYPDLNLSLGEGDLWAHKYYGQSLPQLIQIKKQSDPHNVFNFGDHSLSSLT